MFIYSSENITERVHKVLLHYQNIDFIDIIPWTLPVTTIKYRKPFFQKYCNKPGCTRNNPYKCVRNFAQTLHYFDCLFRSMYVCSYVGFWDHDELFLPRNYTSIPRFLLDIDESLNLKFGALSVHQTRCKNNWKVNNKTQMSTVTYQSLCFKDTKHPQFVKSIVKPEVTLKISIHTPLSILPHYRYIYLKTKAGIMYHYHYIDGLNDPIQNELSKYHSLVSDAQNDIFNKLFS